MITPICAAFLLACALPQGDLDDLGTWEATYPMDPTGGVTQGNPMKSTFSLGPRVGYLRGRDTDDGTWTVGAQARLRLPGGIIGVEGSIEFHQDEYADGDILVTQYPVQVTGLVFPFGARPEKPLQPYGLLGVGWYYTRIDYDSVLLTDDETDHYFGVHLGVGGELTLGPSTTLSADFRWVFADEPGVDNSQLDEEEFDFWQLTAGLNIRF